MVQSLSFVHSAVPVAACVALGSGAVLDVEGVAIGGVGLSLAGVEAVTVGATVGVGGGSGWCS